MTTYANAAHEIDNDRREVAANLDGYDACMDKIAKDRNPHASGTSEYSVWEAGWLQAADTKRTVTAFGI